MIKRGRYLSIFVTIFVLVLGLAVGAAQGQSVFRIGVLDDPHGPVSSGARLAVQLINDGGGVRGADGTLFRLELVIEPTNGGSTLAQAVERINQASVIAALGPVTNQEVLNGLNLLQALNVPVLTPALGDTVIASDSSGRIFRSRAAEVLLGRALADYIINDLALRRFVTVQMDLGSTAGVVGFTTAAAGFGAPPQRALLFESGMSLSQLATAVMNSSPEAAVVYGPPEQVAQLYIQLRASGWQGVFAYNQLDDNGFRAGVPFDLLRGVLGMTTWSATAADDVSEAFLVDFVQAVGRVPQAVEAAAYDSVMMLAAAIGQPGDLQSNLARLRDLQGVQGVLNPGILGRGETSNNTAVIQIGPLGGAQVVARYVGAQRVEDVVAVVPTAQALPTATPDGVVVTIKSNVQNVRTGPGMNYDVLGQLRQGEQAKVIGATIDFSWVVIEYRSQNGWLATSLLDVFGDRSKVPVIAPPPTPTPPPPTNTPPPAPLADIIIVGATPTVLNRGQNFLITVTVQNIGTVSAGQFAIATTLQPDNVYSGVTFTSGLGAGQQTTIVLTGSLPAAGPTGIYSVPIIADLNQEVNEGPAGEANNADFLYRYRIDRPVLNSGTLTLNPGGTLSLEGAGVADVQWNAAGTSLDFPAPPAGSGMYIITGVGGFSDVHYDLINTTLTTTHNLNVALLPNALIGIVTAEGNRGVMRVDTVVSGGPITLSYRVYQP